MAMDKSSNPAVAPGLLHHPFTRAVLPFANGGLAGGIATVVIQPVDMVKVRMQLAGEGVASAAAATTGGAVAATPKPTSALGITGELLRSGRLLDLYTGLSAGLLRQAVYTTARMGLFDTFTSSLKRRSGGTVGFTDRAAAGLAAGGLAALISNPADLALIRMQADGLRPKAQRANYTSAIDALVRISRTEGVTKLWAGCTPTIVRAMALNFGQLAFFSEAKARLAEWSPNSGPRARTLAASAVAGFFASFFSLPFDFVKTRLQKQTRAADGSLPYRGTLDCFAKVARQEGLLRFYRGFGTYYLRIAPHAMVTLIAADYLGWLTK